MPAHSTIRPRLAQAAAVLSLIAATGCLAADGKLLLTGGVSSIDGAAGGGITPWAVTGSYATRGQWGGTAHVSAAHTQDYALRTYGAALAYDDRVELSLARQDFDARDNLKPLGLTGLTLRQDIVGAKVRLAGDAVLDADTWMPQVALGLLHKRSDAGALSPALHGPLGARKSDTELYFSATKLFLAQGLLVNGTLRYTRANQNGLLGFGSAAPGRNSYSLQPEFSVAYLLRRDLAIGAEYRFKPNNLEALGAAAGLGSALREDDWKDIFVAWAPSKNLSLTLAWVDLGRVVPGITGGRKQTGAYVSAQMAF